MAIRRSRRAPGPYSLVYIAVILALVTAYTGYFAVTTNADYARSHRVQLHGIRATGVTTSVTNVEDNQTKEVSYSARISVELSAPLEGQTRTTVHLPHRSSAVAGQAILLLLDPRDPTYAELPGQPTQVGGPVVLFIVMTAVFGLLFLVVVWFAFRGFMRRRVNPHQSVAT